MAVNGEAVQQVQHQHDEHHVFQPPDDAEVQQPPGGEEKAGKGADDGRQVRCVGGDDRGDADIEQQEKVKVMGLRRN